MEKELIKNLEDEGYDRVYVYESPADEVDEEHGHDFDTKLKIISGKIRIKTLVDNVITDFSLESGQQIEIPKNQLHSAIVGSEGCKYIVAEKYAK